MLRSLFAFLIVFSLMACDAEDPSGLLGSPPPTGDPIPDTLSAQMLEFVNSARLSGFECKSGFKGAAHDLSWSAHLAEAALRHSQDLFESDVGSTLPHDGSDGTTVVERVTETGYDWFAVGENLAFNFAFSEEVVEAWLESDTNHCDNLMNPAFQQMGAAKVGDYWTQVFAAPK